LLKVLFLMLLCDGYLWLSVRRTLQKLGPGLKSLLTFLFWLPAELLLFLIVYGLFVPFADWNIPLRTNILSLILILVISGFSPMVFLVLADFLRVIRYIASRFAQNSRESFRSKLPNKTLIISGWLLGLLIFLLLISGTLFWQFDFRVRRQKITLPELPGAFDGFKIVQFSDVHLGSWGSKQRLQEAMNAINGLNPDVIFFTGDMFNYSTADGKGFEQILKTIHAPYGIYAIMGNHDYGDYITWPSPEAKKQNIEDLKAWYNNLGWKLLLNSNDLVRRGKDSIAVIGVENWGATHRFQRIGNIAKAQQGTETMAIQLLLSHDPSHWDSIVRKKYQHIDVTFSGHTHGGQMGIDCCNIHWSPVAWISRLWCGLYTNPDSDIPQYLYVNQGLGNIGYAGRVGILPEITLFTLHRGVGAEGH
jgi:uncharacterized protein